MEYFRTVAEVSSIEWGATTGEVARAFLATGWAIVAIHQRARSDANHSSQWTVYILGNVDPNAAVPELYRTSKF